MEKGKSYAMTVQSGKDFNREQEIKKSAKAKDDQRQPEKEKFENNASKVSEKIVNEQMQKSFKDAFVIDGTVFNRQSCKVKEVW